MTSKTATAKKGMAGRSAVKKTVPVKSAVKKTAPVKSAAKRTSAKKGASAATEEVKDGVQKEIDVIVNAILDKKGRRVCAMDLRKLGTGICDYFVLCNADSTVNVSAIADNIEDEMIEKCGRRLLRSQGKENSFWVIQDYGDIVVHIFQTEYREFYRLEELWNDCDKKIYDGE